MRMIVIICYKNPIPSKFLLRLMLFSPKKQNLLFCVNLMAPDFAFLQAAMWGAAPTAAPVPAQPFTMNAEKSRSAHISALSLG
ncbi:hypothetical protein [Undibacterium griseum]|uniref:Uncharacterized protein n=1 Tax=Undibacterium griseum TaxID=2762295 RepID=A0ABR6YI88_9BURK|nr:hypothetical protein [Undibacterium griseum]MBC3883620.1 hypothetical protein [Undibacterium griseum]